MEGETGLCSPTWLQALSRCQVMALWYFPPNNHTSVKRGLSIITLLSSPLLAASFLLLRSAPLPPPRHPERKCDLRYHSRENPKIFLMMCQNIFFSHFSQTPPMHPHPYTSTAPSTSNLSAVTASQKLTDPPAHWCKPDVVTKSVPTQTDARQQGEVFMCVCVCVYVA